MDGKVENSVNEVDFILLICIKAYMYYPIRKSLYQLYKVETIIVCNK